MSDDQLSFPFISDNSFTVSTSSDTIDLSISYSYNSSYDSMATSTFTIDSLNPSYYSMSDDTKANIIKTSNNIIDMDKLYETVNTLAERLAVISADEDLMAKYPTLRDAYNSYQLIETLVKNDQNQEDEE